MVSDNNYGMLSLAAPVKPQTPPLQLLVQIEQTALLSRQSKAIITHFR